MVKLGFIEVNIIFMFLLKKQDCGYSLEPPVKAVLTNTHNLCFEQKYEKISEFFYLKTYSFWWWNFLYIWIGAFSQWYLMAATNFSRKNLNNSVTTSAKFTFGHVRPAKIKISQRICEVRSEFSSGSFCAKDARVLHLDIENPCQTAHMARLICVFVGRTCQKVCFLTLRVIIY